MKLKIWGCRGSIAICNPDSIKAGGNTTCFEIKSDYLPENTKLMIDAGTGFVPASGEHLSQSGTHLKYIILFTHWHYDHILGLTLSPPTFIKQVVMDLYGPEDNGVGPQQMLKDIFKRPYFPVDSKRISDKMKFKTLFDFDVHVILIHPQAGATTMKLDVFNRRIINNKQMPINGKNYDVNECLVIKMAKANHANSNCISYRIEERPTNKVLVINTDNEDVAALSTDIKNHLKNADLLIADAQYDDEEYLSGKKAGFGHGTPMGCVMQALNCDVNKLGLTHHDPNSHDSKLFSDTIEAANNILRMQKTNHEEYKKAKLTEDNIFVCQDYSEIEV